MNDNNMKDFTLLDIIEASKISPTPIQDILFSRNPHFVSNFIIGLVTALLIKLIVSILLKEKQTSDIIFNWIYQDWFYGAIFAFILRTILLYMASYRVYSENSAMKTLTYILEAILFIPFIICRTFSAIPFYFLCVAAKYLPPPIGMCRFTCDRLKELTQMSKDKWCQEEAEKSHAKGYKDGMRDGISKLQEEVEKSHSKGYKDGMGYGILRLRDLNQKNMESIAKYYDISKSELEDNYDDIKMECSNDKLKNLAICIYYKGVRFGYSKGSKNN